MVCRSAGPAFSRRGRGCSAPSRSHLEPPRRAGRGSGSSGEAEIAAAAAASPRSTGGEPGAAAAGEEEAAAGVRVRAAWGLGNPSAPPSRRWGSPGGADRLCWAGLGCGSNRRPGWGRGFSPARSSLRRPERAGPNVGRAAGERPRQVYLTHSFYLFIIIFLNYKATRSSEASEVVT